MSAHGQQPAARPSLKALAEQARMMPWEKSPDDVPHQARHAFKEAITPDLFLELVEALEPFTERNSSDDTITLTLKTADVARARAVLAKVEGMAT